jgi:hypothetical protein
VHPFLVERPHHEAHFHLQPLDHPATSDDVKQGRAIFSLDGQARIFKTREFPIAASSLTLKDGPFEVQNPQPDGSIKMGVEYFPLEGWVWQAEELRVGDEWQRFYGFVGPHLLQKISASEMEFPHYGWTRLDHAWDAQINEPETDLDDGDLKSVTKLLTDNPLPVTVRLRNRFGLDQAVPGRWIQPEGDSKHLPAGTTLAVSYSPKLLEEPFEPRFVEECKLDWQTMPLSLTPPAATAPGASRMLRPTETVTALKVDLRDFADFNRPGSYRVKIAFPAEGSSEPGSVVTVFSVYAR